jgi:hypothetical protein
MTKTVHTHHGLDSTRHEDVVVLADRDVDVQKSEQARTGTLPKNLITRLSRSGSLGGRGVRTLLTTIILIKRQLPDGLDSPRHATPRPGEASERARVARPSPFTNFTSGPPLVHPLS